MGQMLGNTLGSSERSTHSEAEGKTFYEIKEVGRPFGMTTFDQAIVREINSPAPLVSGVPKMRREVIFLSRIRIADNLELLRIVVNDDPSKCVGRGLMRKMAAHISDAKLTLRARLVQMVGTGRRPQMGRPFGAFCLQALGCRSKIEVESEDKTCVNACIIWSQRKCMS